MFIDSVGPLNFFLTPQVFLCPYIILNTENSSITLLDFKTSTRICLNAKLGLVISKAPNDRRIILLSNGKAASSPSDMKLEGYVSTQFTRSSVFVICHTQIVRFHNDGETVTKYEIPYIHVGGNIHEMTSDNYIYSDSNHAYAIYREKIVDMQLNPGPPFMSMTTMHAEPNHRLIYLQHSGMKVRIYQMINWTKAKFIKEVCCVPY